MRLKVLTLGIIQGHTHEPVEHWILVNLSTPTKTHPLGGHTSSTSNEVLILKVREQLVEPVRTIDASHDVNGPWVVVSEVSGLMEPLADLTNNNCPHH